MKKLVLLLVVAASTWAGIALDRAGWKYQKQLWQFQWATTGLVAGYLLPTGTFQADLSSHRRLWERKLITVLMAAKVTRQVRQKSL